MSNVAQPSWPAVLPWQAVIRTKPVAEFNQVERFVYLFEPAAPENARLFCERLAELLASAPVQSAKGRVDAERYRTLKPLFLAADFAWGDPPTNALVFQWPQSIRVSADLDQMVDALHASKGEAHE